MLVSDPVFKKVYEAFERHDSCVTIVSTKSMDALSTICAVAAANATCAIYINNLMDFGACACCFRVHHYDEKAQEQSEPVYQHSSPV